MHIYPVANAHNHMMVFMHFMYIYVYIQSGIEFTHWSIIWKIGTYEIHEFK